MLSLNEEGLQFQRQRVQLSQRRTAFLHFDGNGMDPSGRVFSAHYAGRFNTDAK